MSLCSTTRCGDFTCDGAIRQLGCHIVLGPTKHRDHRCPQCKSCCEDAQQRHEVFHQHSCDSLPQVPAALRSGYERSLAAADAAVARVREGPTVPLSLCAPLLPAGTGTTSLAKSKLEPVLGRETPFLHHRHDFNVSFLHGRGARCFLFSLRDPVERLTTAFVYDIYQTRGTSLLYEQHLGISSPRQLISAWTDPASSTNASTNASAPQPSPPSPREAMARTWAQQTLSRSRNPENFMVRHEHSFNTLAPLRPYRSDCGKVWDEAHTADARRGYDACLTERKNGPCLFAHSSGSAKRAGRSCPLAHQCSAFHLELCAASHFLIPQAW